MRQIINESEFSVSWMKKYKRERPSKEKNDKLDVIVMWILGGGQGWDQHANRGSSGDAANRASRN